jgi:hypothetical protein
MRQTRFDFADHRESLALNIHLAWRIKDVASSRGADCDRIFDDNSALLFRQ